MMYFTTISEAACCWLLCERCTVCHLGRATSTGRKRASTLSNELFRIRNFRPPNYLLSLLTKLSQKSILIIAILPHISEWLQLRWYWPMRHSLDITLFCGLNVLFIPNSVVTSITTANFSIKNR